MPRSAFIISGVLNKIPSKTTLVFVWSAASFFFLLFVASSFYMKIQLKLESVKKGQFELEDRITSLVDRFVHLESRLDRLMDFELDETGTATLDAFDRCLKFQTFDDLPETNDPKNPIDYSGRCLCLHSFCPSSFKNQNQTTIANANLLPCRSQVIYGLMQEVSMHLKSLSKRICERNVVFFLCLLFIIFRTKQIEKHFEHHQFEF